MRTPNWLRATVACAILALLATNDAGAILIACYGALILIMVYLTEGR
jgi:hypothetical protein